MGDPKYSRQAAYRKRQREDAQEAASGPNIGLYGDEITRSSNGELRILTPSSSFDPESGMLRLTVRHRDGLTFKMLFPKDTSAREAAELALFLWGGSHSGDNQGG